MRKTKLRNIREREEMGKGPGKEEKGGGVEERRRGEEKGKERKVWERRGKGKGKTEMTEFLEGFYLRSAFAFNLAEILRSSFTTIRLEAIISFLSKFHVLIVCFGCFCHLWCKFELSYLFWL